MHSFQGVTTEDRSMFKHTRIQFGESGRSPRRASMTQAHLAVFVLSFVPGLARSPLHIVKTEPDCFSLFRFPRNLVIFVERNVEGDHVRQQIQPLPRETKVLEGSLLFGLDTQLVNSMGPPERGEMPIFSFSPIVVHVQIWP